ncbi:MAG: glycosyltransferase family 2 protein [Proteobacteria bacterium]|nr:glycosyltransferase family 2 protein [Pseudomonadota bacterium]MBU1686870.1 glycosyltransferase family 2 protein [Pseudomonadota bacterium]
MLPTVSVIIPVHNGGEAFGKCLRSINATQPAADEIIVVADGESDGNWRLARDFPTRIVLVPEPSGPGRARNLGAEIATGEILLFIDADITIPTDTIGKVREYFQDHPDVSAIMGSYDDQPSAPNFLSQYKNLFHHYTHQTGNRDASTFWSGCGAVRTGVFRGMNGFAEQRCRPTAGACPGTIEDVELGYRMKEAGHQIHLVRELQVKHLKYWNWHSLLKTDFFYRALPWTELLLTKGRMVNDLNIKKESRLSVMLTFALVFCWFTLLVGLPSGVVIVMLMAALLLINWGCYRFFYQKRGLGFALLVIPWHWFYFFYSGIAFLYGSILFRLKRG